MSFRELVQCNDHLSALSVLGNLNFLKRELFGEDRTRHHSRQQRCDQGGGLKGLSNPH